ncbi:MAG: hypothetical protein L6Q98_08425 [Anaerolineae bacterium]|nr:hypothetical protein [Anaerolineae bacterium]NUQ02614.1 hypothetical protein [Anaerolineae bacterium]
MTTSTFTFDPANPRNIDRVRIYTGQTVEEQSLLTDEEITFLLSEEGGVGAAVVAGLELIINKLSQPDFKVDWLTVSAGDAIKSYRTSLAQMRNKFGVPAIAATPRAVYRPDSLMTDAPEDW